MLKKISPILIITAILILSALNCIAAGPPGPPGPPPCWPPPCTIPLDGGISLLIVAGVALGGKKFYDLRKKA
ncbi:MAG: hypothetical protein EPN85_12685 [Bacteroidetes bacterium]|nr:MAG: hypothetical protein EPN85_12685 [Bacteroidota bacterium]